MEVRGFKGLEGMRGLGGWEVLEGVEPLEKGLFGVVEDPFDVEEGRREGGGGDVLGV